MIPEEVISLFKMMFGDHVKFLVKQVKSQRLSGVIYVPKQYKRKKALVLIYLE
jgi:hypothetical protein